MKKKNKNTPGIDNGTRGIPEDGRGEAGTLGENRLFRDLMEEGTDGRVITDREGLIVCLNREAERLLGRSRVKLVGRPFGSPLDPSRGAA